MTETKNTSRTSLYLVRRADALLGVLRFFLEPGGNGRSRRLTFLAQSDFWEWEVENLIYSFTNFAERSRAWRSPKAAAEQLNQLGIVVPAMLSGRPRWRGSRWQANRQHNRVAPLDLLREAIDTWNRLIDLSDQEFVQPAREKAEKFNIQARKDLRALKKAMPALGPMNEEDDDGA